jgi:hypothetical protein
VLQCICVVFRVPCFLHGAVALPAVVWRSLTVLSLYRHAAPFGVPLSPCLQATDQELLACHSQAHIDRVRAWLCGRALQRETTVWGQKAAGQQPTSWLMCVCVCVCVRMENECVNACADVSCEASPAQAHPWGTLMGVTTRTHSRRLTSCMKRRRSWAKRTARPWTAWVTHSSSQVRPVWLAGVLAGLFCELVCTQALQPTVARALVAS